MNGVNSTLIPLRQISARYSICVVLGPFLLQVISSSAVIISFSPQSLIYPSLSLFLKSRVAYFTSDSLSLKIVITLYQDPTFPGTFLTALQALVLGSHLARLVNSEKYYQTVSRSFSISTVKLNSTILLNRKIITSYSMLRIYIFLRSYHQIPDSHYEQMGKVKA